MRLLFATPPRIEAGSIQAIRAYIRAGEEAGHEMVLWGKEDARFRGIRWSEDLDRYDHVVFVFESNPHWLSPLRLVRVLSRVPRQRRTLFDADGMYNEWIVVDDYDRTTWTARHRDEWVCHADALAGRIFQPTPKPRMPNVGSLLFYGHPTDAEVPRDASSEKALDVMLVGHNWWRWREVHNTVIPALERLKGHLRGVCFHGNWWDGLPPKFVGTPFEMACQSDPGALARAGVEVASAVPFSEVISTMSCARVNLMTQRPLFRHLRLLTSKFFEILCADTVPLVTIDQDYATEIYGPAGVELVLPTDPAGAAEKIADAIQRQGRFREIVDTVRVHVRRYHGYDTRVEDLTGALAGQGSAAAASGGAESERSR